MSHYQILQGVHEHFVIGKILRVSHEYILSVLEEDITEKAGGYSENQL